MKLILLLIIYLASVCAKLTLGRRSGRKTRKKAAAATSSAKYATATSYSLDHSFDNGQVYLLLIVPPYKKKNVCSLYTHFPVTLFNYAGYFHTTISLLLCSIMRDIFHNNDKKSFQPRGNFSLRSYNTRNG